MNTKWKLILVVGLLLLGTSSVFLSACSILGVKSTSDVDSRIAKLETDVKANGDAITTLKQQVTALTPASPAPVVPVTPPAPTAPVTPVVPPVSTAPPKPTGVLPSASVVLDKLTITPQPANIGQVMTFSIQVTNTGTISGSYRVVMTEKMVYPEAGSGLLEYANVVTLTAGETKTVTFTTGAKNVAATYSVEAGTKVSQYTVLAPPPPAQPADIP